ncbi:hypothetical protein FRACYDRAFT_241415 [Fragilariopsis cylindrus CCMP1102]|uniref:Uncharacterized protein n=1 Tax=Fragilariopsis cylindrus CCMP1102 TaxID=635003 RepID=A0A1E7F9L6_9STRA|nr:hypothetical protein FRACYDRAFT_241415 [Fragilariopsis cylindrus CCMP1102]|eukprot:OEU14858.1 hypothetical protein FRACYDRAFT_241415 [Fragilariopsis cylindrus CCMP1102]
MSEKQEQNNRMLSLSKKKMLVYSSVLVGLLMLLTLQPKLVVERGKVLLRYETKKSVSDGVDEIGGDNAHYAAAAAQGQAPGAALEFNEHRNSTKFRPLLIINHNAKAGGGSILETNSRKAGVVPTRIDSTDLLLEALENRVVICYHGGVGNQKGGGGLNKIREQMGSHQFQSLLGTNRGGNNPYYNSTSDLQKFQQWIQYPSPMSEQIEYQFCLNYYYGISQHPTTTTTGNAAGLDCWVIIEDFSNSLLHCLYMYENQGGFVNWTSSLVAGLVQKKIQEEGEENNNNNTHHHRKIAKQVEDGSSKVIYDHFGYIGCCSKEFNRSTIYGDDYNDNDNRDDKY